MDLTNVKEIRILLEKYDAKPKKNLGQNFLVNQSVLEKIMPHIQQNDTVIEIGPGLGTLTKELSKKSGRVVAIEKDTKMCEILKETLKDLENTDVVHADILNIEISELKVKNYKVVANLPYYVSTAIIRKFLETKNSPKKMIVTVQKEVAQRICAHPPDMSVLSVSVQFYAEAEILFKISRNAFWPPPKIDSAVLEIIPKENLPLVEPSSFFKTVKAGFSRPRAQLLNNLSKELKLNKENVKSLILKSDIDPKQRAEKLTLNDWINLTQKFQ